MSTVAPAQIQISDHQPAYNLVKIWRPAVFQGGNRSRNYFEGWYFKVVTASGDQSYAFIPGMAIDDAGAAHAFIQFIDGQTGNTEYFSFPDTAFHYSQREFSVSIGGNRFSRAEMVLALHSPTLSIQGQVRLDSCQLLPRYPFRPGIMGPFRFAPGMETYHGLVSMDHSLSGELVLNERSVDLNGGRGYIEKDWGSSFPQKWIWMQTNHFEETGTSFMCSIASIPYLGLNFDGFLAFLLVDGEVQRWSTYTGARVKNLRIEQETVYFELWGGGRRLEVRAHRAGSGELAAPVA